MMNIFKSGRKTRSIVINTVWIAGIFLLFVSPSAKALVLRFLLFTGLFGADMKPEKVAGEALPQVASFQLVNAEGRLVHLSDFQGKTVFINFWASWCPPCRAEMPSLNNLYQQFKKDSEVVFLFVTEDEDSGKALAYVRDHNLPLPLYTHTSEVPGQLFSGTLPTTVILDKKGSIVWRHEGLASYDAKKFAHQLNNLNQ